VVELEDLPPRLHQVVRAAQNADDGAAPVALVSLFEVERRHVLGVLTAVNGNKTKAAKILGIDRKTLQTRLVRYGYRGRRRRLAERSAGPFRAQESPPLR
ncbi:MAG TPA: helix-turn-helix domain-containing protein, partial [Polyangiaceae bacterium]|nr:helix-turn-helix domain-containing protein [Polyangiaceae bacterium]